MPGVRVRGVESPGVRWRLSLSHAAVPVAGNETHGALLDAGLPRTEDKA